MGVRFILNLLSDIVSNSIYNELTRETIESKITHAYNLT